MAVSEDNEIGVRESSAAESMTLKRNLASAPAVTARSLTEALKISRSRRSRLCVHFPVPFFFQRASVPPRFGFSFCLRRGGAAV